jgi:dinuclear metal center YbgI/SA1388 family protein
LSQISLDQAPSTHELGQVQVHELVSRANEWLQPARFKDYGTNGLQVQGAPLVGKLISGVTASLALIESAALRGAKAILVHHGLFWKGQDATLTGWMRERVASLIKHDINLIAYHLPLDAHPLHGNNAQLAIKLGLLTQDTFGDQNLGHIGCFVEPSRRESGMGLQELVRSIKLALGREPLLVAKDSNRLVRKIAWCTGGAQSWFDDAIKVGADAYITGEISEPQAHLARETGVAFIACGHHATERYGVQALGNALAQEFNIAHEFIDIDNPA